MKNYFIKSDLMKYLVIFNVILFFFGRFTFLIGLVFSIPIIFSYRKIRLTSLSKKDIELNSIFSPISGKVKSIKEEEGFNIINIKTNFFGPVGVYMPFSGTVDQVERSKISLFNKLGQNLTLQYERGLFRNSQTWLKPGDLANYSSNIGFLGLYGGINIKAKKNIKVLVEEGQKVFSGQSIIAGFEVTDER